MSNFYSFYNELSLSPEVKNKWEVLYDDQYLILQTKCTYGGSIDNNPYFEFKYLIEIIDQDDNTGYVESNEDENRYTVDLYFVLTPQIFNEKHYKILLEETGFEEEDENLVNLFDVYITKNGVMVVEGSDAIHKNQISKVLTEITNWIEQSGLDLDFLDQLGFNYESGWDMIKRLVS